MVQPINYLAQMPQVDIGDRFLQGLRVGSTYQQMQEQQAAKQQVEQRLQAYRTELENAFNDGTPKAFSRLMTMFPEHQAAIKPTFDQLSKERQQGEISAALPVASALLSGNSKVAKDLLETRIKATPEGEDASGLQYLSSLIDKDQTAAKNQSLMVLSQIMSPDKFAETFSKLSETSRAEAIAPITQRKESAEATLKEIELKFKPEKLATDLQLTKTQIQQANAAIAASKAAAAKSGAEASRAQAEARQMSAGIIPIEKRPEMETKFRKEYSDQTKGYQEVKSAYGRLLASDDSAVGDLSLIFGYMKMLDPGSVVREGEFATAQNAAGVPERIINIYNKTISGERLSESQRKSFKGQAGKLYSTAKTQEDTVRKGIDRIAKGYGLNTSNIFYEQTESLPTGAVATPTSAGGGRVAPVSVTAPNGQVLSFPSQQAADAFKKAAGVR
jgi:hypothetical protein